MSKRVKKHGKTAFIIAITISLLGIYLAVPQSNAAAIANRELAIDDSRPNVGLNVIYDFEGDHSATLVSCLQITFCANATGECGEATGIETTNGSSVSSTWSGWIAENWTASNMTASIIRYTAASTAGGGTDFSFSTASVGNPTTPGTYFGRVTSYDDAGACTNEVDSGVIAFAIIEGVLISATVAETLTLSMEGVTAGDCDSSFTTLVGPSSNATTVAFGTLSSLDTFFHACTDLGVITNAASGYGLTAHETTNLLSGTDTIDDSIGDDGTMTESVSEAWTQSATNGFAYACGNIAGNNCVQTATADYRQFACVGSAAECDPDSGAETAVNVMATSGAVNASSRIQYKLSVDVTQEAGDYTTTIVYIATPTF